MSFRGRDDSGLGSMNKMEPGDRKFGGGDVDKEDSDDRPSRFDPGRGRLPPFGRGRRPSPPGRDKPFGDRQRDFGGYGRNENNFPHPGGRDMMRDRSPVRGPDDRYSDRFKKNDRREEPGRKDGGRPYYEEPPRDRYAGGDGRGPANYGSRFDPPTDFKHRPTAYSAPPPKDYSDGFPKPNECEIIAMNRQQRLYAESVEARIKGLDILVDVLFLKDEALLTQTIDDIARKGSLYAMVISPQNETHGSVTVNILHGTPQEHRNMPLEDALKLVSRNFHEYVRSQKESVERERAERGPYTGAVPAGREMQLLLRMLADGRWVSLAEINSVLLYLTERRDKMRADERVRPDAVYKAPPPPSAMKDDADVAQKEQDLQNRIINIMNQGAPPVSGAAPAEAQPAGALRPGAVVPARAAPNDVMPRSSEPAVPSAEAAFNPAAAAKSEAASTATYINFDNPSVKKALDNLMQSGPNLLKSISLGGQGLSSAASLSPAAKSLPAAGGPLPSAAAPADGGAASNPRPGMGARGVPDMPGRGPAGLDMAAASRIPGMGGLSTTRPPPGGGYGGMGAGGRGYGAAPDMSDMSRMGQQQQQRAGGGGMGQQNMSHGPPMHGGPMSRGGGGNFSAQGQFNKYQGPPGQQSGNFPPFGSGNMGGMPPRPNFGGPQGPMGPRRF